MTLTRCSRCRHFRDGCRLSYGGRPWCPECWDSRPKCAYCGTRPRTGNRRLCSVCSRDPAAQAAFPPKQWQGTGLVDPHKLPEPTRAPPGSPEKLTVLARRAAAGMVLHHPRDADGWDEGEEEAAA